MSSAKVCLFSCHFIFSAKRRKPRTVCFCRCTYKRGECTYFPDYSCCAVLTKWTYVSTSGFFAKERAVGWSDRRWCSTENFQRYFYSTTELLEIQGTNDWETLNLLCFLDLVWLWEASFNRISLFSLQIARGFCAVYWSLSLAVPTGKAEQYQ